MIIPERKKNQIVHAVREEIGHFVADILEGITISKVCGFFEFRQGGATSEADWHVFALQSGEIERIAEAIDERPPLNEDPRDGGDRDEEDMCDGE